MEFPLFVGFRNPPAKGGSVEAFAVEQSRRSGRLDYLTRLKMVATFVTVEQFACVGHFSGLSAPPVTCPYRTEQATGTAGGYDFHFKIR